MEDYFTATLSGKFEYYRHSQLIGIKTFSITLSDHYQPALALSECHAWVAREKKRQEENGKQMDQSFEVKIIINEE